MPPDNNATDPKSSEGASSSISAQSSEDLILDNITDNLKIGTYRTSPTKEGAFVAVNRTFVEMLEAPSKEELKKHNVIEIYANPADRDDLRQSLFEKGIVNRLEIQFKSLKGKLFWVALTAILKKNAAGQQFIEGFAEDITEQKLANERILEEKIINESIVSTAINGILVVDPTGKAILFNKHFVEMFGIPEDILKTQDGNKMSQHVLKKLKDPKKFIAGVRELALHKELKSKDEVVFKDGHILDRFSSPLIDATGNYHGRAWFFYDITEQKKSQTDINQAKLLNESIVETALSGILVVDETGKAILFNKRFTDMFGIPAEILKTQDGNKMSQYVLRQLQDPKKFIAGIKELYLHQEQKSFDEVIFKDGRIFERYSSPSIDANNQYHGRVWFFRDITEKKQAETAIFQAKLLNESIINTTIDGILVVDQRGKAIVFNQRFCEMFGISQAIQKLQDGNKMSQSVLPKLKYPKKFIEGIKELALYPNLQSSDEVEFKDGRFLDRYSAPLIDAYGNNYGRAWFFRDITERKRSSEGRFKNIFENSPGPLGEADFSELKTHLSKLKTEGIDNIELYLKIHKNETYNCLKLIKFTNVNNACMKVYEASNLTDFNAAFLANFEKEKQEMALKLICAVAADQKNFSSDLEDLTKFNNKIEVIFQYSISTGYEDFSKVLIAMVDVTKLKQIEKQLAYSAVHDPLTNLPNRILFNETLNNSLYRSKRTNTKMALLYLDVDNFKIINDTQGHDIGDAVLVELGNRIKEAIRQDDFVARLGGDEFAIVLNGLTAMTQAGEIASKIKSKIDGSYKIANLELPITSSIGISIYPDNSEIAVELIKYADIALYSVKNSGRNNYKYHLASANFFPKINLENELILALQRNQFFMVFQPEYAIKTEKMVGIEAFIRWQHTGFGLIFPDNFIPLIEHTEIALDLGYWIIENCCAQYMKWAESISNLPKITINLCNKQLLHQNFLTTLDKILSKTKMPPQQLEFDLNETTITDNIPRITEVIKQLQARKITINLDNINNTANLQQQTKDFGIEQIKIEPGLIANILTDTKAASTLQQILSTAKQLKRQVVIIGIESKAQLSYLAEIDNFLFIQGYYLCKPLTAEEMSKVLQSGKFF